MTEAPDPPEILTGCALVKAEISKYPEWNIDIMAAIAEAENRTCDPLNHNLSSAEDHGICIGSYGVLQVGCVHYAGQDVNSLSHNVAIAYEVWQKQGYSAWTMYNNGIYRKFL